MTEKEVKPARIEIEGPDGIALRQLAPEDAQAYFDLIEYDRAHLSQNHDGNRDDTADKYQTVEDVLGSILNPSDPAKLRFGIWIDGAMVGSNNLTPSEENPKSVESGSWIGKKYTGHHYAMKGRQLLTDLAIDLGYEVVFSDIAVGNEASRKSVEKSGFTYKGLIIKLDDDGSAHKYWRYTKRNT